MSGAEDRRDPLVGTSIDGRYHVIERIGAGGMAVVYRATQLNVDRSVAIKVLGSGSAARDDLAQRFQNEARVIARLRHPNILKLHDVGTLDDGRLYIVTELLHGSPLDHLLRERAITPQWVVRLMQPVTEALAEAHAAGVIHRDLKPANMFVERMAEIELLKVLDFGIAKLAGQAGLTASGAMFGTPRYMSPEQVLAREIDGRSDIYSLGVVLFECLSGRVPFDASWMHLFQRVNEPAPRIGTRVTGHPLPAELEALVDQMLAREPGDRPQTMLAVRDRLRAIEEAWWQAGVRTSMPAPIPVGPTGARLLAGPEAALDASQGLGDEPVAERAHEEGATSRIPPPLARKRGRPWLLPFGIAGLLGLLGLLGREAAKERAHVTAPMVPVAPTQTSSAPTAAPIAPPAQLPVVTATTSPVVATPPPSPVASPTSSASPSPRRRPRKSTAPIPSGFEDVDYRELDPR